MTREHILPRFLYRQFPTQKTGYNIRADKFMTWEPQVKDVCRMCNNGALSGLDGYAREFLSSLHCERTYTDRVDVTFAYDYVSLVRWLLKVSYNSTRAVTDTPRLLRQCVPFILDESAPHPPIAFVAVEVIRDTPVGPPERALLSEDARTWTHIPTKMFRVGPGLLHDPKMQHIRAEYVLRFVAINAWYFTYCITSNDVDRAERRRLAAAFASLVPDGLLLSSGRSEAKICVSRRTGVDAYTFQGLLVQNQWREYARIKYPGRAT